MSRCRCMTIKERANRKCEQRNVAPPSPSVSRDLCSLLPPSLLPSAPSFGHSSSERSSHILGQEIARRFDQTRKQRNMMLGSQMQPTRGLYFLRVWLHPVKRISESFPMGSRHESSSWCFTGAAGTQADTTMYCCASRLPPTVPAPR